MTSKLLLGAAVATSSSLCDFVDGHGVEAAAYLGGVPRTITVAGGFNIGELVDAFELRILDAPALLSKLGSEVRVDPVIARLEAELREETNADGERRSEAFNCLQRRNVVYA